MIAPGNIQNYRNELCVRCPTPCEFQKDTAFRAEGDNECPIARWRAYELFVRKNYRGLGDVVAAIADPIAGTLDKVLKTNFKGCGACFKRQEGLNYLFPFTNKDS